MLCVLLRSRPDLKANEDSNVPAGPTRMERVGDRVYPAQGNADYLRSVLVKKIDTPKCNEGCLYICAGSHVSAALAHAAQATLARLRDSYDTQVSSRQGMAARWQ